ncbi:MAG: alkaline phosphatase family protein [Methanosarcinales archaeon]|nr:MAG: alkaline phosphatase family protein [Methanosarcinales archaeon]
MNEAAAGVNFCCANTFCTPVGLPRCGAAHHNAPHTSRTAAMSACRKHRIKVVCCVLSILHQAASRPLPAHSTAPLRRLAFGSCNKAEHNQDAWAAVDARHPDAWLWLGDIVYADAPVFLKWRIPASPADLARHYAVQKSRPEYADFEMKYRIAGVYDDHDYGANDGDKTYESTSREASRRALLQFLDEDTSSPRWNQSGVWALYTFGEAPRRTRLILLDNRTLRDPYGSESTQDMLGEEQWAWLEHILRTTTSEITLIGSGLQVLARGDPLVSESWSRLPQSQARLLALIAATGTTGVLFLSGDVHFAEINRVACDAVGYPLYDFTSSGLTHSWGAPVKRQIVDMLLMASTRVPGAMYPGKNFGTVEIMWPEDGADASRGAIVLRAHGLEDGKGDVVFEHTISFTELLVGQQCSDHCQEHSSCCGTSYRTFSTVTYRHSGSKAVQLFSGQSLPDSGSDEVSSQEAAAGCAKSSLNHGFSQSCALFQHTCEPHLTSADMRYYLGGHALFGLLGGTAALVTFIFLPWIATVPRFSRAMRSMALAIAVLLLSAGVGLVASTH